MQQQVIRSTRAVTASAQDSDLMHKRGEHAGKVHDNTCLTYVNWLEAICRIARVRIDRREKRRLHIRARNKQEAEEGLTADSDGNFSASNNDAADDQDELSDTFSTSLSNEVDTILEKNIIQILVVNLVVKLIQLTVKTAVTAATAMCLLNWKLDIN